MPALGLSALTLCIRRRPSGAPPPALATLQVQWTDESAIEDAFRVRWVPTAGGTTLSADTAANVETYTIAGLSWNTQYDVEITAVNGLGESDVLGPVALYTPPPTAPTLCTATETSDTTATIGWTLPGTEPVTGYRIYRSPAGAGTWTAVGTVAAGVATYAATGLTASTAYDWRVTGYNSNAASSQPDSETDPTNTATCTTDAPSSLATATDTFNRTNADPMSTAMSDGVSSWTNGPGALGNPAIVSNAMNAPGTQRGAVVAAPTFAANQRATITLTAQVGVGAMVRMQSGVASGYLVYLSNSTTIQFYRIADSGSIGLTQLGSNVTISAVTAGDTIGAEVSGTTITALRNGVSVGTRTDATYTAGQPGVYMGGSGVTIDAFTATDL